MLLLQHSADMLTAETGRVCQPRVRRSRRSVHSGMKCSDVQRENGVGQDVGQAHVLLSDTLQIDRSARPYRVVVSIW